MNRLIIVGNGFDLAHGLKTSYCDFLSNYLNNIVTIFQKTNEYSDPLISISHVSSYFRKFPDIDDQTDMFRYFEHFNETRIYNKVLYSNLLKSSIQKAGEIRWVDLENDYFTELQNCKKLSLYDKKLINELNIQFDFLKMKLEEYLGSQEINLETFEPDGDIKAIFNEGTHSNEYLFRYPEYLDLQRTHILNFNYTNTVESYFPNYNIEGSEVEINYIHGKIGDQTNRIVFGFGDEHDHEYLTFENLRINELFHHIKSFAYFKTKNYDNLIRFLDAEDYEVFILGHSCGLSDRTMLREIFEHNNCLSVKIFYHQITDSKNDFTEKTYEIARHFTDKNSMRKKIVKEPNCTFLPQHIQTLF